MLFVDKFYFASRREVEMAHLVSSPKSAFGTHMDYVFSGKPQAKTKIPLKKHLFIQKVIFKKH